jgi:hypothetical protein
MGNDGITYETGDQKHFATFAVGQTAKIKYAIQSKQSGGKIYTSYKLVNPNPSPRYGSNNTEVLEALRKVFTRLEEVEKNIIAAIDLKDVKIVEDIDIPVINEELSIIREDEIEQGNDRGLPF